jgi:hypothetical protein
MLSLIGKKSFAKRDKNYIFPQKLDPFEIAKRAITPAGKNTDENRCA